MTTAETTSVPVNAPPAAIVGSSEEAATQVNGPLVLLWRMLAGAMVVIVLLFLLNNYLIFWRGWPGFLMLSAHHGWLSFVPLQSPLSGEEVALGWLQFLSYLGSLGVVAMFVLVTRKRSLRADASLLSALAAYIVRAAFWSVVLVGLADMLISFLRVEGLLQQLIGAELTTELGRSRYRGAYVHYPLIALSLVIALFVRTLGFIWLALLVVVAEFQIVISRFIFSYEQAFMGDLVRFWYAALFLFASAYALI
ncbi:MAG: permease, partial [Gammaproteobacteria bacterium]|nr:permease [Gammaproteobacteria bacterium]